MKPEELRIGNYVNLSTKLRREMWDNEVSAHNEYFKVDIIYSDGDIVLELDNENIDFESKDIDPIELTEEWLLKFGFSKSYGELTKEYFNFRICGNEVFTNDEFNPTNICKLEHVHQLQNLFYCLCGSELTIKNEV